MVDLDPKNYEHREWVALAWARDWVLFRGEMPDQELVEEFESLYSEQERGDILAVVTAMDFANRFMNTTTGDYLIPATEESEREVVRKPGFRWGEKIKEQ